MSADRYRQTNRAIVGMINAGKVENLEAYIAPDGVDHQVPEGANVYEGLTNFVAMFKAAFPDLHITIDQEIVEGDTMASRFTMTGTHQGEFMGAPPSGKSFRVSGVDIIRFADGLSLNNTDGGPNIDGVGDDNEQYHES